MCTQPRKGLLAQCWSGIWVSLLTGFMATDPLFKAGIKEKNMKKKKKKEITCIKLQQKSSLKV